jgi:hypothetical protein
MMSVADIREFLDEKVATAESDWKGSNKIAPNSYGAGYDRGYLDAINELRRLVNGEPDR